MTPAAVLDVFGLVLIAGGAALAFTAGLGLLRFPDLMTRMHAGTKPQILGVILVLAGLALRVRTVTAFVVLALVATFQMLTVPVAGHMIARAGLRTGRIPPTDIHLGFGRTRSQD